MATRNKGRGMAHIRAIIKTYSGRAGDIAHYVEQIEDWMRDAEGYEFVRLARELDAAQSALAIAEKTDPFETEKIS